MPRNFARYEQFLRIFALLELLSAARQPLDDRSVIASIQERLVLTRLSPRTLRRDCEFLTACGYAIDHVPLPDGRKYGWMLAKEGSLDRRIPREPLTLLEIIAFTVGRDLLQPFEGTILWTGIESLRFKLERDLPAEMRERLEAAKRVFHVRGFDPRYAARPRLISTLSRAITDSLIWASAAGCSADTCAVLSARACAPLSWAACSALSAETCSLLMRASATALRLGTADGTSAANWSRPRSTC